MGDVVDLKLEASLRRMMDTPKARWWGGRVAAIEAYFGDREDALHAAMEAAGKRAKRIKAGCPWTLLAEIEREVYDDVRRADEEERADGRR